MSLKDAISTDNYSSPDELLIDVACSTTYDLSDTDRGLKNRSEEAFHNLSIEQKLKFIEQMKKAIKNIGDKR